MTPSARTYTGIMQIFFGGSTASGVRGQHAVDFPIITVGHICLLSYTHDVVEFHFQESHESAFLFPFDFVEL